MHWRTIYSLGRQLSVALNLGPVPRYHLGVRISCLTHALLHCSSSCQLSVCCDLFDLQRFRGALGVSALLTLCALGMPLPQSTPCAAPRAEEQVAHPRAPHGAEMRARKGGEIGV